MKERKNWFESTIRWAATSGKLYVLTGLAVAILWLAGCAPLGQPGTPLAPEPASPPAAAPATETDFLPSPTPPVTPTDRFEPLATPGDTGRPAPTLPGGLEQVPTREAPISGEVPAELLEKITADLTGRLGAGRQEIQVVQAEAVVWNDGSLGCPKPGQAYTQAQVEGYHVVLEIAGREYDYRASEQGSFFLCEPPV